MDSGSDPAVGDLRPCLLQRLNQTDSLEYQVQSSEQMLGEAQWMES